MISAAFFLASGMPAAAEDQASAYHVLGFRVEGSTWAASSNLGTGFLTDGPYTRDYQDGTFTAKFQLSVDNNSADDLVVAFVDVYDDETASEIARREIHRKEFDSPRAFQAFELSFVTVGRNNLSFRVYVCGAAYVAHKSTSVVRESSLKPGVPIVADAPSNRHELGFEGANGSWMAGPQQGHGYLSITQLSPALAPGSYAAALAMQVRGSAGRGSSPVTLDVYNRTTNTVLAVLRVPNRYWRAAQRQTVEIPFSYDGVGDLETRVYVDGTAYVGLFSVTLCPRLGLAYDGSDWTLSHKLGIPKGSAWISTSASQRGLLTYGPNSVGVPPGVATATFNLAASEMRDGAESIAEVDVYDTHASRRIAKRLIKKGDFASTSKPQDFDLVFEIPEPTYLEFRVFTMGAAKLQHNSTVIRPDRLTLSALWNQKAHFEFRQRDFFVHAGVHDNDTASLVALDGLWYAFNRAETSDVAPAQAARCSAANRIPLQVVVRASANRGATWSDPVIVALPGSTANASDGCEVVDGGAFFDSDTDTWHYLGQCIGIRGGWAMCHYMRKGSSPMGLFEVDPANPVVTGGALWSRICEGRNRACVKGMIDEGTPQVISKSEGYFYVTFHGALYGSTVTGARGIARTSDFRHWQVSGDQLPNDAILSARDCNEWRVSWANGECIGEGAARILRSAGQYYQLAEAADLSLLCKGGQTWVFGLLRSPTFGRSGTWQNYDANPFIENQNVSPVGCALQYMNLFRDRGEIFLEFSLYTPDYAFPNYTYQLVGGGSGSSALKVN